MNDFLLIFEDCSCKYICKPTEHKARGQAKELKKKVELANILWK